ncbi:peptidyl-prolyl cis-trans isomerase FKBP14-like [Oscarella lobularis]|uniref:peptidyl-prolyl cis-trans isomerase FKBP14-like n=1 Tax=Oscarella lobularis TaxID=121494 RepID=UPI003313F108
MRSCTTFALLLLVRLGSALDFSRETVENGENCLTKVERGNDVSILYKAFDDKGTLIESRFVVTEALKFRVGFATGKMAQLWNEALLGMCQGEVADIDVTTEEIDSEHFPVGTEMKYTVEVDEVIVRGKERKPPLTIENFKLMDLDHDGILLKSELREYTVNLKAMPTTKNNKMVDQVVETFFNLYDKNKNGEITRNEFTTVHSEL